MSGSKRKKLVNTSRPPPTLELCRINCYVLYGIGVAGNVLVENMCRMCTRQHPPAAPTAPALQQGRTMFWGVGCSVSVATLVVVPGMMEGSRLARPSPPGREAREFQIC
jgi:hypothetical protein